MPEIKASMIQQFEHVVGRAYVHHAAEVLSTYESDAFVLLQQRPDLVVLPRTTEEVAAVVKICAQHALPFIARGGRHWTVRGGRCLSRAALSLGWHV